MIKNIFKFMFFLVLTCGLYASGFQINENGARAMAMGGAFTALANDASAVYYNGAGITQLKGTQFNVGVSLIAPSTEFTGPAPSNNVNKQKNKIFTPINFYFSHQLNEKLFLGFAINNPFGLGTEWTENWPGRYLAIDTEIRTFFFNPIIAYKINDQFSVSGGFNLAYGDVKIIKKAPVYNPLDNSYLFDTKTSLKGDGWAYGFTLSALYKVTDVFSLGVNFRSQTKFDFKGDASSNPASLDFVHPLAGPTSIPLPTGDISAKLNAPLNLTIGAALKASELLTLVTDFQYVGWSSYDKLVVNFSTWVDPGTGALGVIAADRKYKNSYIARLGAEYEASNKLDIRGGVFYDKNPVQDKYLEPTLPDADRIGLNVGLGYALNENISVDIAYLFLLFSDRTISNSVYNFNGKYESNAHLLGLNLTFNL